MTTPENFNWNDKWTAQLQASLENLGVLGNRLRRTFLEIEVEMAFIELILDQLGKNPPE